MATFNNFCLMVIFMATTTLLVKTGLSYEDYDPYEGPVPPMTDYEKHLTDCIFKLHSPCDELYMFGTLFFDNETISKDCCTNIHDMGKLCHDTLTTYNLELPKFKANRTKILQRSNQVWNQCNHTSAQPGEVHNLPNEPTLSPSYKKYLGDCAAKLHPHCGDQFYSGIFFNNGTISQDCCKNLVTDVGKPCKDNMTKFVLRTRHFEQTHTQIFERSEQIWNACILVSRL